MIAVYFDNDINLNDVTRDLNVVNSYKLQGFNIKEVLVNGKRFLFANLGCTKVQAASLMAALEPRYNIDTSMFIGNTAMIDRAYMMCRPEVAISSSALQYDVNFTSLGYQMTTIPIVNEGEFNSDRALMRLACNCAYRRGKKGIYGKFASADRFLADKGLAEGLRKDFGARFADTEAGIVGQMAFMSNKKYVVVKGISNDGGYNAANDYNRNKAYANNNAVDVALEMVQELAKGGSSYPCMDYRELTKPEMMDVIGKANYLTLSMSKEGKPYSVPMYYRVYQTMCGMTLALTSCNSLGDKMSCLRDNKNVCVSFNIEMPDDPTCPQEEKRYRTVIGKGRAFLDEGLGSLSSVASVMSAPQCNPMNENLFVTNPPGLREGRFVTNYPGLREGRFVTNYPGLREGRFVTNPCDDSVGSVGEPRTEIRIRMNELTGREFTNGWQ